MDQVEDFDPKALAVYQVSDPQTRQVVLRTHNRQKAYAKAVELNTEIVACATPYYLQKFGSRNLPSSSSPPQLQKGEEQE